VVIGGQLAPVAPMRSVATGAPVFNLDKEFNMPLINLIITLIVVGVLLWLVNTYIPMDRKIKSILNVVIVIAVVLWLLSAFGLLGNMTGIRVGG
jgi:hypothetical protein